MPIYLGNPLLLTIYKSIHADGIDQSIRINMLSAKLSNSEEWTPPQPDTWPWRGKDTASGGHLATLRHSVVFRIFNGRQTPQYTFYEVPAGARVKIVMVSRFGDVGITDDMNAERVYRARVHPDSLEKLSD